MTRIKLRPQRSKEFDDATLLSNGNVIFSRMSGAAMVSPDKQIVWAWSSWKDPDLGPATSIQLLDELGAPEDAER